jgi:FecR protein
MHDTISQQELGRLIDAICDRSIDDEDAARLNALLACDPAARASYLEQMWMDAELFASFMHSGEGDPEGSAIEATSAYRAEDFPAVASRAAQTRLANSQTQGALWSSSRWLTIAAALLIVCLGSGWLALLGARGQGPLAALLDGGQATRFGSDEAQRGEVIASISGSRDCRWGEDQLGIGYGSLLHVGQQLDLKEGLVEVTFKNGARIVLEGPATFLVPGDDRATLLAGRMSAAVPRTASGFTVGTHRLAINDAGTQFGLVAYANGGSEVHVFEGPVHARAIDSFGREVSSVQLSATEAARLAPIATDFALFNANGDRFVRTLARSVGPSEGLLAVEEFDYPYGPLAWQNGGFGWAEAWADLYSANEPDEPSTNTVAEGSLAGGELISQGNRAIQTTQFNRVRRVLSTSLRGVFDVAGLVEDQNGIRLIGRNGKTIYVSFMQRVSVISDGFYGFELHRGDGNSNRVLSIGYGAEATGYGVSSNYNGVGKKDGIVALFAPLGNEDTETHLFVVRIDFGEKDRDVATIYRDPDSLLDERLCMPAATLEGNFAFDRISLGVFESLRNNKHEIDEIRVGTSFTAVTGQRSSKELRLATQEIQPQGQRPQRTASLVISREPEVLVDRETANQGPLGMPLGALIP